MKIKPAFIIYIFLLLFGGRSFAQRVYLEKSLLVGKWKLVKVFNEKNNEIELSECAKKEYIEFKNSVITNVSYRTQKNNCSVEKTICNYKVEGEMIDMSSISCFNFISLNEKLLTVKISGINMSFRKEN